MEFLSCPTPPEPYRLVMARISNSNSTKFNPISLTKHFPNRDVTGLIHSRVVEHHAVIAAISAGLGHNKWHLEHETGGRPILFERGEKANSKISTSHIQCPEKAFYAVAMIADVDYNIGVDIVYTNDERLERIANRTMSDNEIEKGNLPEIWALKEAVYKANGPAIDFKNEIVVQAPVENSEVVVNCKGEKEKWLVHEVSCVTLALGPIK